ncbi:MAG: PD40 domain-containing protein [Candidatus Kapabacteria bacterium]|nr:PD40 domain-containing protein [Candidatus Kapabacteria bacterium]
MKIIFFFCMSICLPLSTIAQVQQYKELCTPNDDYATSFRTVKNGVEIWLNTSDGMKNTRSRRLIKVQCNNSTLLNGNVLPEPINQREENSHRVYLDGSPTFAYCDTTYGIFVSNRSHNGADMDNDLYEMSLVENQWKVRRIDELNSPYWDDSPCLSKDGNILFFATTRDNPNTGLTNIYYSIRTNAGWSTPQPLSDVNTLYYKEEAPFLGSDGYLYFSTNRDGDLDIYRIRIDPLTARTYPPEMPVPFEGVNQKGSDEALPTLSAGGSWLLFSSNRTTENKKSRDYDIWMSKIHEGNDTIPIRAITRTRTFNTAFEEWEDIMLPCATELIVSDKNTGLKKIFALDKEGGALLTMPRATDNTPCNDYRYRELIVTVKPPIVTNKEFIAETDTLLIDVLAQKNYNHTLYVWDKSIPEDRECVQNFPVTEVQFFLTCYWCPTTLQYSSYLPCQSVFKDSLCTTVDYQIPEKKCDNGDIYSYTLDFTPPKVSAYRNTGLCIPGSELANHQQKILWANRVDTAVETFIANMKSALQRPCVQKAIRKGQKVNVEVIGWTDPRGIDPACLYTGEEINFAKTFIRLHNLEKKKHYLPNGILKSNTRFRNSGEEGNELLSDVRAYYTALLLDSLWTEYVPDYKLLKSMNPPLLEVTAMGKGIKKGQKGYEFKRSANVIVRTPGEVEKLDPYKEISGRFVSLTGMPCAVLYNRTIASPVSSHSISAQNFNTNTQSNVQKHISFPSSHPAATPKPIVSSASHPVSSENNKTVMLASPDRGTSTCFTVLLGIFDNEESARKLINFLDNPKYLYKSSIAVYFSPNGKKEYRVISNCFTSESSAQTGLLTAKDILQKNNITFRPRVLYSADQDIVSDQDTVRIHLLCDNNAADFCKTIQNFYEKNTHYVFYQRSNESLALAMYMQKTTTVYYYSEQTKQTASDIAQLIEALTGMKCKTMRETLSQKSSRPDDAVNHITVFVTK